MDNPLATLITVNSDAIGSEVVTNKQAKEHYRCQNNLLAQSVVTDAQVEKAQAELESVRKKVIKFGNQIVKKHMGEKAKAANLKRADNEGLVEGFLDLKHLWKNMRGELTLSLLQQVFEVVHQKPDPEWLRQAAVEVMQEAHIHVPGASGSPFGNFVEEIIALNCLKDTRKFTSLSRSTNAVVGLMSRRNGPHPMDAFCKYVPTSNKFQYQHITGWADLVKMGGEAEAIQEACNSGKLKNIDSSVEWGLTWLASQEKTLNCSTSSSFSTASSKSDGGPTNVTVEEVIAVARAATANPAPPVEKLTLADTQRNQDVRDFDLLEQTPPACPKHKARTDELSALSGSTRATRLSEVNKTCLCCLTKKMIY